MFTFFLIIHIVISFLLIVVILLQSGKGGGLASAFGGSGTSSDATYGGRQAATFLSKATMVLGTIFLVSSFGLALLSSYRSGATSAVQQELQQSGAPAQVGTPAPVAEPTELFQEEAAPEQQQEGAGQPQQ